jgi:hypothetical protein
MSREAVRIGGKVWRRLIDAGGYVYTARDGTMSIHFHRGVKPTRELVDLVRLHRRELRMFVSEWHARDDARWSAAPRGRVLPAENQTNIPNAKVCEIH